MSGSEGGPAAMATRGPNSCASTAAGTSGEPAAQRGRWVVDSRGHLTTVVTYQLASLRQCSGGAGGTGFRRHLLVSRIPNVVSAVQSASSKVSSGASRRSPGASQIDCVCCCGSGSGQRRGLGIGRSGGNSAVESS